MRSARDSKWAAMGTKGRLIHPDTGSKTDAVLDFLASHRGRAINASTVADSLGLDRKVTATLLARLAGEGKVEKVGRGMYGMPTGRKGGKGELTAAQVRVSKRAGERWRRAYEEISKEAEEALGPAATRIRRDGDGRAGAGYRAMTERLVKELREGIGGRMALDMVLPILEGIFGDNGRDTATRLCGTAAGNGREGAGP